MTEALNEGLQQYGKQRTQAVVDKVRTAIAEIEREIDENEGLYPYNAGRLTKAEVCRRAGITAMTLQGPAHKGTTNTLVEQFLERVRVGTITGRSSVRKMVTERAENWKAMHARIANAYHQAVLENNKDKHQLKEHAKRIKDLEAENAELKQQLARASGKNITLFPGKGEA